MLERYLGVEAVLIRETEKAVMIQAEINGVHHESLWIPKSVLHEDSQDDVEIAVRGETTELYVQDWWIQENT